MYNIVLNQILATEKYKWSYEKEDDQRIGNKLYSMCIFCRNVESMRVNKKEKAIFKLRGNREREELPHCAVLTMSVEEFSHVQYSALPSVEWQQRGRKHGRSFARLHHRRTM